MKLCHGGSCPVSLMNSRSSELSKPSVRRNPFHVPLRVAVLVDLERTPSAGGHVKSWERFADAAARRLDSEIDLSVHFIGRENVTEELSPSVRFVTHRAVLGTHLFDRVEKAPGHTDIAPYTRKLIPHLADRDVIHTTDAWFAQARTALRHARRTGTPLVTSLHTDVPSYTRIFFEDVVRKLAGSGRISSLLLDRWRIQHAAQGYMARRLHRYLGACRWVLASNQADLDWIRETAPGSRCSVLRRGIDKETFHPGRRDRRRLRDVHGIALDSFLAIFVGRLDAAKKAETAARAVRLLADRGAPVHILFAGDGAQRHELEEMLGPRGTFLGGGIPQRELGWLYASSDLFVFPSETEINPNVVIEAKASGLPVLVSAHGGSAQHVTRPGKDGFLLEAREPAAWADAIDALRRERSLLRAVGGESRRIMDSQWPSWNDVLFEDVLPVWREVSGRLAPRSGGGFRESFMAYS